MTSVVFCTWQYAISTQGKMPPINRLFCIISTALRGRQDLESITGTRQTLS